MHLLRRAVRSLPFLVGGLAAILEFQFGAHADSPGPQPLIIQQSGTTKGAAVIFNCGTNVTCTISGAVVTASVSAGCSPGASPSANVFFFDNGNGCPADATAAATIPSLIVGSAAGSTNLLLHYGSSQSGDQFKILCGDNSTTCLEVEPASTYKRALTTLDHSETNGGVFFLNFSSGAIYTAGNLTFRNGSSGSLDTGISRDSAGVIAFGTGIAGGTAGSWKSTAVATPPVATPNLKTCTTSTGTPWRAAVNDAIAPAIGSPLTGGGSIFALVHCSLTTGTYIVDG